MEQGNECLKCIELKKSLQVEKKKVSQKNRLITLLKELVRSYEAKDLNLTFTDLSRIYESSSSEVTILKQRLTLYLNENQELLQLKNEISSRNDLLEKKYRDVEDEISHLRFVNKQLGDYYREKEADHDQYKDRLKKLARKLLNYEPKNSEVRKILNLQNTPIESDNKSSKNGNKKKNEENPKDMKKDNIEDDSIAIGQKPLDILNSEELDISVNNECDDDTECDETNNFVCIEEGSNSSSPEPDFVHDAPEVNGLSADLMTSQSVDDISNTEKSCEIISNVGDGVITCEESDSSSNCADSVDHCSFYKNISKDSSSIKIDENKSKSSEVLPSLFEEDSCAYEDVSEQNEIDANHKDSHNYLEFEDSLPDLISPLKSDESRVLSYLDCSQVLHDSVVQDNSNCADSNKEVIESDINDKNEKVSTDIKNECSSNSGDQTDKKKKSPHSVFQSKYQPLNDGLLFSEKPMNGSHLPLNGSYASNYQFQSSHCFGCCNNSFDARPPVTLKLYNCTNVEISIPPMLQKDNLPIITVRDKCDLDKCFVNTPNDVNKPDDSSTIHCSFIPDKRKSQSNDDCNNQCLPTVLTCTRPTLNRSNHDRAENVKEPSNPYFKDCRNESKKLDYYFSDYLSQNHVSESNSTFRKQWFGEGESDTIKCSRMFPIKAGKQFDLEHFCYRFGSLSLKYSIPESTSKLRFSDNMHRSNKYSSLFNISQPPVFHNSLKKPQSLNNKNEWVFGQSFLNGTKKQGICQMAAIKPNNLLAKATEENSADKIKHCNILQKSVFNLKTDYLNRKNIDDIKKNGIPAKESVRNPFNEVRGSNEFKGTKDCFRSISSDINSKKTVFNREETSFERKQLISQSFMKPPVINNQISNEDINHKLFKSNSVKLQSSQSNVNNPSAIIETSKSESDLASYHKGCSKSIFDCDKRDVSTGNSATHSSICNSKPKCIATPHVSPQKEAELNQIQKPSCALTNSDCTEEAADEQSISPTKERLKENLFREKPAIQKERSPKNIKHSSLPQSKNISVNHDHLFKKPESVNVKAIPVVKNTENNLECNSLISKGSKLNLNEKSTVDSPKKADHFSKVMKKKSSPEVKISSSKKMVALNNGLNKEPKSSNGTISKPAGSKRLIVSRNKSININHGLVTDEEEDENLDSELQEIFKEMGHITTPLLSPLAKTPEISPKETPALKETENNSVETSNLIKKDTTAKSKEYFESKDAEDQKINYSPEKSVLIKKNTTAKSKEYFESKDSEDQKINYSPEKSVLNKQRVPKCNNINSRLKDNETIPEPKQSFSSVDESKYKLFSDNDETDSLDEDSDMHIEDSVNDELLEDREMEKAEVNEVNDKVLRSAEINNFSKTEDVKIYSRKRKLSADTLIGEENYAPRPSLSDCNSEETKKTTDNSFLKDFEISSASENKFELSSSTNSDNKSSIGFGFYVNRSDEESLSVPSLPETSELEQLTNFNEANPDPTTEVSSIDSCIPDNNSSLQSEGVSEGKEMPLGKEESPGNKRKPENNDHVEGMCSKKQKIFSDDEYISCESDVFICALRYLSAAAVASSDEEVSSLPKSNTDTNITTKIAINHIKNLIIEALQSIDGDVYDVLNSSVKEMRQINDASPTSLAKAILELIVESNDKSEAKDKPYMPSMTKTVKMCVLTAVSFIGYNRDFVMKFCEVFEQYISSFYDKSLRVAEGSQLVIFYTSFCRSYNLDDKVKYLIYDVLYTRNIKAYPMVYKTVQTWPDILPHSDTCFSKDCLLTQTIIFILLTGASAVDEKSGNMYCISNIRSYLFKYFGYKCNFIRREELTDKIIENISTKGGSIALVLLCKCEPWEWSLNVVEKKLLPILQYPRSMDESTVCEYVLTVGRVVRGFPITKAGHIVKQTLEVFERMLLESNSNHLSEVIIEAISLLRRHNLMKCTSILINWKPNTKQITEKTINHISTILRVKNIGYWKNVYSAHSSNIIHNTRTFRKKRKPGFQNSP